MAEITTTPMLALKFKLVLDEQELRALNALTVYGKDQFLETFYTHLGKNYLGPHETGLATLFESIRAKVPNLLDMATKVRKTLEEELK